MRTPKRHPPEEDLALFYERHSAMVYRRCTRFFEPQEAEDMTQEVFVHLAAHLVSFRGESSPVTWLYAVTTNLCLKRLARERRRQSLWLAHQEGLEPPSLSRPSSQEAAVALKELQEALPEELVAIGMYCYGDGMTHEEIADLMGVSRRTVGNRLKSLQEHLERFSRERGVR